MFSNHLHDRPIKNRLSPLIMETPNFHNDFRCICRPMISWEILRSHDILPIDETCPDCCEYHDSGKLWRKMNWYWILIFKWKIIHISFPILHNKNLKKNQIHEILTNNYSIQIINKIPADLYFEKCQIKSTGALTYTLGHTQRHTL